MVTEIGKAVRRQKRIVAGIDNPGRDANGVKVLLAAALFPVMLRVAEAMQRRRVTTVKITEGLDLLVTGTGELVRETLGLETDFLPHETDETSHIYNIFRLSQAH